jgi:hypothetical protein
MQYLVVRLAGAYPAGTRVAVRTAEVSGGVPKGKADLNVRNSPGFLSPEGLTPLPSTARCLVLRSWSIARNGKTVNPPFYDLLVQAPGDSPAEPFRALTSLLIEPEDAWFRPEPDVPDPTMEVTVP